MHFKWERKDRLSFILSHGSSVDRSERAAYPVLASKLPMMMLAEMPSGDASCLTVQGQLRRCTVQ